MWEPSLCGPSSFSVNRELIQLAVDARLLEAGDLRAAVVGLMPAFCSRAREQKFCGRRVGALAVGAIQSKKDGCTALSAKHTEEPARIGSGPFGNMHRLFGHSGVRGS